MSRFPDYKAFQSAQFFFFHQLRIPLKTKLITTAIKWACSRDRDFRHGPICSRLSGSANPQCNRALADGSGTAENSAGIVCIWVGHKEKAEYYFERRRCDFVHQRTIILWHVAPHKDRSHDWNHHTRTHAHALARRQTSHLFWYFRCSRSLEDWQAKPWGPFWACPDPTPWCDSLTAAPVRPL